MNLLIDSGNSFIKWAFETEKELVTGSQCLTADVSSLQGKWEIYDTPGRVLVSNVAVKSVASEIIKAVTVLWQLDVEFLVSSQNCCGLINSYHKPEQLGIDRWMAMLAAFHVAQGPVIVIDCGTAVTIDLVNDMGTFVGGVIMPGLNSAFQSLSTDTDAVEEVETTSTVASVVAQSTGEAVQAGVILGLAGGIERVVREQSALIEKKPVVFMTGGDVEKFLPYLSVSVVVQSNLVLEGLKVYAAQ